MTLTVIIVISKKQLDDADCHRHRLQPHRQICDQSGWKCGHGSKGGFEPKQLKVEAARPHFSICLIIIIIFSSWAA